MLITSVQCSPAKPLVLRYEVYANDNSVRTAWLDAHRGFFNGTSLCLKVCAPQTETGARGADVTFALDVSTRRIG